MVNYKLSNMPKMKRNLPKVLVKTRVLARPSRLMAMESKKNTAMPKKKRNSLKVLVKMNLLVRLSKSMAMESKKNSAMPKKQRNSLKVLVKMNLLVKPLKSMEMESKKSTAMLKQKKDGKPKRKTKMMIFSWLKLLERELLLDLLVLKVPLFQNLNIDLREEITTQSKEPKTQWTNSIMPQEELKPDLHICQPYNLTLKIQEHHSVKVMLRVPPSQILPMKENVETTTQSKELKTQLINLTVPLKELKPEFHINQPFFKLKKNSLLMQVLLSVKVIPRVLPSQILPMKENAEITTQSRELKIQLINSMLPPKKLKPEFLINQLYFNQTQSNLLIQTQSIL